jgi:hypothetical protein
MPELWAGVPAEEMLAMTDRPPSLRGLAVTVPPWIAAMEATGVHVDDFGLAGSRSWVCMVVASQVRKRRWVHRRCVTSSW